MDVNNLTMLSFDGVYLLLPQQEVTTIEVANNILDGGVAPGALGVVKSGGREWPVFALTSELKKRLERPPEYKFCVCINGTAEAEAFSIACEEVSTLKIEKNSELKAVQPCMRTSDCPIDALILKDNQLMLVSNVKTMQKYLIAEAIQA